MNSFHSVTSGLLSSLLLSLGFSRLAARFDVLEKTTAANGNQSGGEFSAAVACVQPCRWQEV